MTTPADELRAAADKLRRICNAAAPGPWTISKVSPYTDPLLMSRFEETPDNEGVLVVGNVDLEPEDQAVVQLLHPGVGVALADWLEWQSAALTEGHIALPDAALAVARAINGSTR
ncbi:hypothetical protein ACH4UM_23675 [Streptomyces sp. NPDC020801]|uniref:hypothetical protein n=1 Tax=Streptomyces sp. NPDC020801 TaxID=3365093 RepID=UPI0037A8E627